MTEQEIFDRVWTYFVVKKHEPGYHSTSETKANYLNGTCVYWADDGKKKCAIGCLLPEALAKKVVNEVSLEEDSSIATVLEKFEDVKKFFKDVDDLYLRKLQTAHDQACTSGGDFYSRVKEELRYLAEEYKLQIP
jgi:hypothetical protein